MTEPTITVRDSAGRVLSVHRVHAMANGQYMTRGSGAEKHPLNERLTVTYEAIPAALVGMNGPYGPLPAC